MNTCNTGVSELFFAQMLTSKPFRIRPLVKTSGRWVLDSCSVKKAKIRLLLKPTRMCTGDKTLQVAFSFAEDCTGLDQNQKHVYWQPGLKLTRNLLWCDWCFRGQRNKEGSNLMKNRSKARYKIYRKYIFVVI